MFVFNEKTYIRRQEASIDAKKIISKGLFCEAKKLLQHALVEWPRDAFLLSQLLVCVDDSDEAQCIFDIIKNAGITMNVFVCRGFIGIFGKAEQTDKVWAIFENMKKGGVVADKFIYDALIDIFSKTKEEDRIWKVFKEIQNADTVISKESYGTILKFFSKIGELDKARSVFEEMQRKNVIADEVAYGIFIDCLGRAGDIGGAWNVFEYIQEAGVVIDVITCNTLLNILSKAGETDEIMGVFEDMQKNGIMHDEITYTILISSFYKANRQKEIVEKVNPRDVPIDALPSYCDALRKLKRYKEAIKWCDIVLLESQNDKTREHASIVKLHSFLHLNRLIFFKKVMGFQINRTSFHYPRFLAIKVFGGAYTLQEKDTIRKSLEDALSGDRNEFLKSDINNALIILTKLN